MRVFEIHGAHLERDSIAILVDVTEKVHYEDQQGQLITKLEKALAEVKTLSGLLPICSNCKKIRDGRDYWHQVEEYLHKHSDVVITHGICPDCMKVLYPNVADKVLKKSDRKNTK